MKTKLLKILKENKVSDETSKIISDVVFESFSKLSKENAKYKKDEKESLTLLESKLKEINESHEKEVKDLKSKQKAVIDSTRKQVLTAVSEDIKPFKKKLAKKVKNFMNENIESMNKVLKEQKITETKIDTDEISAIKKAIAPILESRTIDKGEEEKHVKLKKDFSEVTEKMSKLVLENKKLKNTNISLITENKSLKKDLEMPLKKKPAKVKLDESKSEAQPMTDVMVEMKRLASF